MSPMLSSSSSLPFSQRQPELLGILLPLHQIPDSPRPPPQCQARGPWVVELFPVPSSQTAGCVFGMSSWVHRISAAHRTREGGMANGLERKNPCFFILTPVIFVRGRLRQESQDWSLTHQFSNVRVTKPLNESPLSLDSRCDSSRRFSRDPKGDLC